MVKELLYKLERYGIKGDLLEWLESYISNREQRVVIKDAVSTKGQLKAGVPPGIDPWPSPLSNLYK